MKFFYNGMFVLNFVWRARRKDKDSGSGSSSPGLSSSNTNSGASGGGTGSSSNQEAKLYVEPTVLECTLPEPKIRELVHLPAGLDYNEWVASHTIAFFDHINLLYGTVSEYCTMSGCPDMTGPKLRQYFWLDEKGKKAKVTAPQYIDYVMTFTQKTVNDESIFPTKFERDFPSTFEATVKKIHRLLFHVVAHLYQSHFQEMVLLNLHGHLNCLFIHFMLFNEHYGAVDEKETEVLRDLAQALKLYPDTKTESLNLSEESGDERRPPRSDSPPVGERRFFSGPTRDGRDYRDSKVLTRPPTSASIHHFSPDSPLLSSSITALHTRTHSGGGSRANSCAMQDSAMVHYNPNSTSSAPTSASSQEQGARVRSSPIKFQ